VSTTKDNNGLQGRFYPCGCDLHCEELLRRLAGYLSMTSSSELRFKIEPDLLRRNCFRWVVLQRGRALFRSAISYTTEIEAETDAMQVLARFKAA
jgi:hypothetical protein